MEFNRFQFLVKHIVEEKKDQAKIPFLTGAYNAWLMGAGGKVTFLEYAEKYGLYKRIPLTKEQREAIRILALKKAQDIINADKLRNQKGKDK